MPSGLAGLPEPVFWIVLAVLAGGRFLWFAHFIVLCLLYRFPSGMGLLTSQLYGTSSEQDRAATHKSIADETNRIVDVCLLVGTLALAAWAALFAVANQTPGSELNSTTRSLLLVGAVSLVAAPMMFRSPDLYTTFLGRRSALFIGLNAVGLAFVSLANDLLRGEPRLIVTIAAVVILVAREAADTCGEIVDQQKYVAPPLRAMRSHHA